MKTSSRTAVGAVLGAVLGASPTARSDSGSGGAAKATPGAHATTGGRPKVSHHPLVAHARAAFVGLATALLLAGCSSGGEPATVSGHLDDTKYLPRVPAVTVPATRTVGVYSRTCTTRRRTRTTGTGRSRKRSTQSYQDCRKVRTGSRTERYAKVVKPVKFALYCIELDDVNGSKKHDDQWYEVSNATYMKWAGEEEGTFVKKLEFQRALVSCRR